MAYSTRRGGAWKGDQKVSGSPGIAVTSPRRRWSRGQKTAADNHNTVLTELTRSVARELATPDLAPATERAYAHDWADFLMFCTRHERTALPATPQTLALYLKSLETAHSRGPSAYEVRPPAKRTYIGPIGLALSTLRWRLAAIAVRHTAAGL